MSTARAFKGKIRVLIVDDHPLFRMGLRYALQGLDFETVGEAADGVSAVEFCRSSPVDVVLLDVRMPHGDGIGACRTIRHLVDPPIVIMLTTFEEPAIMHAAAEAGASAYLSKDTEPGHLARTVRKILELPERSWIPRVAVPQLTPRELQVLQLLAEGRSNKAMANLLGLSPETVKDHLNGVYRKLEVRDRVSAVRRAGALGLLMSPPFGGGAV